RAIDALRSIPSNEGAAMRRREAKLVFAAVFSVAAVTIGCEARDRSLGTTSSLKCEQLPACQFPCPDGTINPVDSDGCTHTCECVIPPGGTGTADSGTATCGSVPQCE